MQTRREKCVCCRCVRLFLCVCERAKKLIWSRKGNLTVHSSSGAKLNKQAKPLPKQIPQAHSKTKVKRLMQDESHFSVKQTKYFYS